MTDDNLKSELTRLFGHDDFRPGQREIVEAAVNGVDTLAVMPTGGGKSLTYQLPAMLVPGATLVLSPLIALMKDQAENLPPDVAAQSTIINSSLEMGEVGRRLAMVKNGRIKMVYAAPERLRQPPFLHALRQAKISLVVVDEAHCISQWGHDFRPDYRAVGKAVASLNPRSVLAVTATATPDVQDDIERQLGRHLNRIVQPTYRSNLFLSCRTIDNKDDKNQAVIDLCKDTDGVGLVYAGSRETCEQLAKMLRRYNVSAGFYHAGLERVERAAAQDRFMNGGVRVMAATVAFGMGVDKADIRFLAHFNPSRTLENYYQEAGRAGRDGERSHCTLLFSSSDASNVRRYLREDTLTLPHIRAVYNAARALLNGRKIGPVAFDALVREAGGDENLVRAALPLLEESGLISRHVDLPRSISINLEFASDVLPSDEWDAFAAHLSGGGNYDPVELSDQTNVALFDLEETLLRFQDDGHLTFRAGPREFLLELLPSPPDAKAQMQMTLDHRARGQQERADAMLAYAKGSACRHGTIARYFGDRWPNLPCGMCDYCAELIEKKSGRSTRRAALAEPLADLPPVDPERAPIHALQIVADLTESYRPFALGKTGLLRALRGTPDAPIRPDRSLSFGALAALKKADVERLIDALVDGDYLRRDDEDEYRRLYLTTAGREAWKDETVEIGWGMKLTAKKPLPPSPPPLQGGGSQREGGRRENLHPLPGGEGDGEAGGRGQPEMDSALYESLRQWRFRLAQEGGVPPYVIFADKVLAALAAHKPDSEDALLRISGIGPAKAEKYGADVLEMIRESG